MSHVLGRSGGGCLRRGCESVLFACLRMIFVYWICLFRLRRGCKTRAGASPGTGNGAPGTLRAG